jgi:hypothetical protein
MRLLGDVVVVVALVLALGFGVAAYLDETTVAAWLAAGIVVCGVIRLVTIIGEAYSPEF